MRYILFILLISFFSYSCIEKEKIQAQSNVDNFSTYINDVSSVKLPKTLSLFGENIPLDREDIKERAEREFYLLLQQPGQIMLYLKRSGKYFPIYEKYIKEMNMPSDIKYLSVAESALYMSTSSAGATGLWQFISSTGQRYGLTINNEIDERRHPEKSTIASFKYLTDLNRQFNSWISAAAAYNMGENGLNSNMMYQKSRDYFDLYLNQETSRYIFRIALIKEIMENKENYGFLLDESEYWKQENFEIIKETRAINNLSEWAESKGTNYKDVKLLNPWILSKTLAHPAKGKHYEIAIPKK
jgi:hypothetical protein